MCSKTGRQFSCLSCNKIIDPGCMWFNTRLEMVFGVLKNVSKDLIFHPTQIGPVTFNAAAKCGVVTPKGGLNNFVLTPVILVIRASVRLISSNHPCLLLNAMVLLWV